MNGALSHASHAVPNSKSAERRPRLNLCAHCHASKIDGLVQPFSKESIESVGAVNAPSNAAC